MIKHIFCTMIGVALGVLIALFVALQILGYAITSGISG